MKTLANTIKSLKQLIKELEAQDNKTLGDYKLIDTYKNTLKSLEDKYNVDSNVSKVEKLKQYYMSKEDVGKPISEATHELYTIMYKFGEVTSKFFNTSKDDTHTVTVFRSVLDFIMADLVHWCAKELEGIDSTEKLMDNKDTINKYIDFCTGKFFPEFLKHLKKELEETNSDVGFSAVDIGTFFLDLLSAELSNNEN